MSARSTKRSQTESWTILSRRADHARQSSPRNSPRAAESRSPCEPSIRAGKAAVTTNDAVIPSEVEAATQPRTLSGRGQAVNPVAKPRAISGGSFDPGAQDDSGA